MIAFGPVPSRRLGQSLGINNIPPKICTYACVYCQLGKARKMQVERQTFYSVEDIVADSGKKIQNARSRNERIDYICIVPDGEPTLDSNLGEEISLLKQTGIKTAVISNASLVDDTKVQSELNRADWVSLKVDAVSRDIWRKINRPHKLLDLEKVQKGMGEFADMFSGKLVTETMLVQGFNDNADELYKIASFIASLNPAIAYISIPIRPPAEEKITAADEHSITQAFQIFSEKIDSVEYLIGYEGNSFAFTGNVEEDILSITSVHPMREDAVGEFLSKSGSNWDVISQMIQDQKLIETEYNGKKFYMRKI